jgi:hypothetical protein
LFFINFQPIFVELVLKLLIDFFANNFIMIFYLSLR